MIVFSWLALIVLTLLGFLGIVVPGLPGTALIVLGAVIHKLILPEYLSWGTIAAVAALALVGWIAEFIGLLIGTKWGGASRYGLMGTAVGAVIGLFFIPVGLLVGPILGAFAGELLALRTLPQASRSALAAGIGFSVSFLVRIGVAAVAVIILVVDLVV